MDPIIQRASDATDKIQDLVGTALRRLESGFNGRIVNGYGVYADPSIARSYLSDAKTAIDEAMKIMREVDWHAVDAAYPNE
jgi:hypothetical protein